ncbi:MAG TPA: hypothetical protein VE132_09770 [Micromonosporaceae bacterium]|nr:hypothetical protein [Micromonosporaceae bacterium]
MSHQEYDPFARGPFAVGVRTHHAYDRTRNRTFPVETWYPVRTPVLSGVEETNPRRNADAHDGSCPLIVFSHHSGGTRTSSTFLCSHLASHGYVVAAMDHSEVVAPDLARRVDESGTESDAESGEGSGEESENDRAFRIDNIISGRVPDVRFLVDHLWEADHLLEADTTTPGDGAVPPLDRSLIGLVGHSLGGWTVLSTVESDARVASAVALAPGGSSRPMPGVLALTLTFGRQREVPTLFLAAANDTPIPLDRVTDVFDRSPEPKRMFVLDRADHHHFVDAVAEEHEATRAMSFPGAAAWIPAAMRPFAELASAEQAHLFVRALTLAHFDATLRALGPAERFLTTDVEADLTARGVAATRVAATSFNAARDVSIDGTEKLRRKR